MLRRSRLSCTSFKNLQKLVNCKRIFGEIEDVEKPAESALSFPVCELLRLAQILFVSKMSL